MDNSFPSQFSVEIAYHRHTFKINRNELNYLIRQAGFRGSEVVGARWDHDGDCLILEVVKAESIVKDINDSLLARD